VEIIHTSERQQGRGGHGLACADPWAQWL